MIRVENISKYFGAKRALHQLSFRVQAGEIVGLVGKNGAGKSTTLNILSAQTLPSEGDVFIDGVSVTESPLAVRARLGFLPEVPPLYREMTVLGYLEYAGRLRRLTRRQAGELAAAVIAETDLEEVVGERLKNLSRGFQQRVGIAQAIVHRPPVVLLDEPMAGLDPLQIVQIRDLIVGLRQRHTVIFSSHILSEITHVCDRVILIDEGSIKAVGTESELRERLGERHSLSLVVKGDGTRLPQLLREIAGLTVDSVAPQGDDCVQARLICLGDVREQVSRACVEGGLGLVELKREQDSLEDLFLNLIVPEEVPVR